MASIYTKLGAIQVELKAPKNLYNSFGNYKYRNAEGILEALKPYLQKHSASVILNDEIIEVGGRIYVKATATFYDTQSGENVSTSAMAREAESKKGMDDSQVTGTASSYARKYALNGLFLLDDTKDADSDEYHKQTNNDSKIEELMAEIKRTGVSLTSLLKAYNATDPFTLTETQLDDAIGKLKAKESK